MPELTIHGFDFTSAPSSRKPIVQAVAFLHDSKLAVHAINRLTNFPQFETALVTGDSWVAGFDFPFSLPRTFIEDVAWPIEWQNLVHHVSMLDRLAFEQTIEAFRGRKPDGQKHPLRATDKRAHALSPLMLYGVPLAKMFFEGAWRLRNAGLSVIPCAPNHRARIALEAYPALIARKADATKYKDDRGGSGISGRKHQRENILRWITGLSGAQDYGIEIDIPPEIWDLCLADDHGDVLDAVCCCVQAASASQKEAFGIPPDVDELEGWIVDPKTCLHQSCRAQDPHGSISSDLHRTLHGIEAGLKVKHIQSCPIATRPWDAQVSTVLEDPRLSDFDYVPVTRDGRVIGVLERTGEPMAGSLHSCMRRLDDSVLISSDESIIKMLPALKHSGYRLVLNGSRIDGIVTRADVQKLPVRLLVFALVSELEKAMEELLLREVREDDWTSALDTSTRKQVEDRANSRKKKNMNISLLEIAYFSEKQKAVSTLLDLTETESSELESIGFLRNSVAHGEDYCASEESFQRFIDHVRDIEAWIRRISSVALS